MYGIGTTELIVLLIIVLLVFGAGKLPQVGKQLGAAINEFRNSVKPKEDNEKPSEKPQ